MHARCLTKIWRKSDRIKFDHNCTLYNEASEQKQNKQQQQRRLEWMDGLGAVASQALRYVKILFFIIVCVKHQIA